MANYENVYSFNVFDKISEGKKVFVTDRHNKSVALLNDMDVQSAIKIVNAKSGGRYDFWIYEESEVTEE